MSDAEVKKSRATSNDFVTLVKANHSIDGEKFFVSFDFIKHSKRLQSVSLNAADVSRCYVYRSNLLYKYGTPVYSSVDGSLLIWRDPPSENAVDWVYAPPGFCTIRFEPINGDFANAL